MVVVCRYNSSVIIDVKAISGCIIIKVIRIDITHAGISII